MKLLFVSNLFPDTREPYRGLDNATVLHHLASRWEVRALAVRPALPWHRRGWIARSEDAAFAPRFVPAPYLPRIGSRVNAGLMARALRPHLRELREHIDVVLSSWIFPDSCAIAQLSRELGFPFVAIAQGSDVHQYLRVPARRAIIQRQLPVASAVITRSAELARLLGDAGLDPTKLHPIYNGIDFTSFHPADHEAARRDLGLPLDAPLVLFVGNLYAIKNPLLLIRAHAELRRRAGFENTRLVMIGGGPLAADAAALAAQLGTSEGVIFAGRKNAAEVARHMQAADALCLPSENEGVPNVILEAFACGLPVVASDVGGIHEVHTGAHLGRLVPRGDEAALVDALASTLGSPLSRDRIAQHGASFTWQRTADAYDALLRAAAKSRL